MLGLCALLGGSFISSNRESGDGRYDIQLKPMNKNLPGILIELKAEKDCTEEQLKNCPKPPFSRSSIRNMILSWLPQELKQFINTAWLSAIKG